MRASTAAVGGAAAAARAKAAAGVRAALELVVAGVSKGGHGRSSEKVGA